MLHVEEGWRGSATCGGAAVVSDGSHHVVVMRLGQASFLHGIGGLKVTVSRGIFWPFSLTGTRTCDPQIRSHRSKVAVFRIRDQDPNFSIPDPGSARFRIRIKVFLTLKTVSKLSSRKNDMGCSSRIRISPHPGSVPGSRGQKRVHPQNVQLHNVQLQNVQLPNVQLQNVQDTKRPVTKRPFYKTSRLQNVQDTKRPVFENLETCFKKPEAEGRAYFDGLRGAMLRLTQIRRRDTHVLCGTCVMRSMGAAVHGCVPTLC
jgi:hypothetical protein